MTVCLWWKRPKYEGVHLWRAMHLWRAVFGGIAIFAAIWMQSFPGIGQVKYPSIVCWGTFGSVLDHFHPCCYPCLVLGENLSKFEWGQGPWRCQSWDAATLGGWRCFVVSFDRLSQLMTTLIACCNFCNVMCKVPCKEVLRLMLLRGGIVVDENQIIMLASCVQRAPADFQL